MLDFYKYFIITVCDVRYFCVSSFYKNVISSVYTHRIRIDPLPTESTQKKLQFYTRYCIAIVFIMLCYNVMKYLVSYMTVLWQLVSVIL